MSIANLDNYLRSLPDWGFLSPNRPTDADGIIERNGRLCLLEWKRGNTVVPRGQEIMFDALAARGDTVLLVHGTPATYEIQWGSGAPEFVMVAPGRVQSARIWGQGIEFPATNESVAQLVADWRAWADSQSTAKCAGWNAWPGVRSA